MMFLSEDNPAGGIRLNFSPFKYRIPDCMSDPVELDTTPPNATDKVWRLTIDRIKAGHLVNLTIHCNSKLVLERGISESKCDGAYSNTKWSRNIDKIAFLQTDTASVAYRAYKPGNTINTCDLILYRLKLLGKVRVKRQFRPNEINARSIAHHIAS